MATTNLPDEIDKLETMVGAKFDYMSTQVNLWDGKLGVFLDSLDEAISDPDPLMDQEFEFKEITEFNPVTDASKPLVDNRELEKLERFSDTPPTDVVSRSSFTIDLTETDSSGIGDQDVNVDRPTIPYALRGINIPDTPEEPANIESYIPAQPIVVPDIVLPTMEPVDLNIHFEGIRPVLDGLVAIPEFHYAEPVYESELTDEIAAWFLDKVKNGGTGLGADIEAAMFDRAKSRQQAINEDEYNKSLTFWASRGFTLPPGQLIARLEQVQREIARADALLSNEILIKQAELAQANTHFSLQLGTQYDGMIRQSFSQVAQRMLDAAKEAVAAGTATLNAMVARHNMLVEAYKVDAIVAWERIKAEIAKLEKFKIEMEGAKVSADVKLVVSEIYKNAMSAAGILVELYKTRVQAAVSKGELEKLKIAELEAKVSSYNAETQAFMANAGVKELVIKNGGLRLQKMSETIKLNAVELDHKKAELALTLQDFEIQKVAIQEKIDAYKLSVEKWETQQKYIKDYNDQIVKAMAADVDEYKAEVQHDANVLDAYAKVNDYNLQQAKIKSDIDIKDIEFRLQQYIAEASRGITAATEKSKIASQVLHSMITAVSVGLSEGLNLGDSQTATVEY